MAEGIPPFRSDGYLPEGIHKCTEAEAMLRFGGQNRRRHRLAVRLGHWIELGKAVGALCLLIDGSFVTVKAELDDVDAVMLVPLDFTKQIAEGVETALELEEIFLTQQPEEISRRKRKLTFKSGVNSLAAHANPIAAAKVCWKSFYDFKRASPSYKLRNRFEK